MSARARRRRRIPVTFLLVALILAVAAPSLVFSGALLLQSDRVQRNALTNRANVSVVMVQDALERELRSMLTTLTVLGVSGWLEKGEYQLLHDKATQALAGSDTYLIAANRDGKQVLNTRVPWGTPLTATVDAASSKRALASGQPVVSDMFFGQVAKTDVFNLVLPIASETSQVRSLILTRNADRLDSIFASSRPPPGWNYAVLDSKGQAVSGAEPHSGSTDLTAQLCMRPQDGVEIQKRDGVEFVAANRLLKTWGWRVCTWSSSGQLEAEIFGRWRSFVLIVLVVVGASILGGTLLGRLLAGGIQRAAAVGRALDSGGEVAEQHSIVREVDEVLGTLTRAARQRLTSEENLRLLQRETAHRAKNQIAIATALTRLSARSAQSVEQLREDITARLTALGRSVDMMAARPGASVTLSELAAAQLEPFAAGHPGRLQFDGEEIAVTPALAQSLGLVLHEKATNASKYGAWSTPDGAVKIEWRWEGDELVIVWAESGGPAPQEQRGAGFGTSMIDMLVERTLGGRIIREFKETGLVATFRLPRNAGEA